MINKTPEPNQSQINILIRPFSGVEKIRVAGGNSQSHRTALDFFDEIEDEIDKFSARVDRIAKKKI